MTLSLVRTVPDLRAVVAGWRREGLTVGVVPTMGALHEGHLSLVRAAKARTDRVIVTLFVNPKQFNNPHDLALYPRNERDDAAKLAGTGAAVLYVPEAQAVYPADFATTVSVAGPSQGLDGEARPGHFDGVATVVTKLLLQTGTDLAFFGEKDFQQLQVVRRLVRDLDIDVGIVGCPTIREADGFALSSRNVRLPPAAREIAPQLFRILRETASVITAGQTVAPALDACRHALEAAGFDAVDYVELRSGEDLTPLPVMGPIPGRLLAAAWLAGVRLIDNVEVAALSPPACEPLRAT